LSVRYDSDSLIRAIALAFALTVFVAVCLLFAFAARAHDSEQWIADKHLRDPVSKGFCCGPTDCRVLDDNDVKEVSGGFLVHMKTEVTDTDLTEVVPYNRAMPFAPDGRYHACLGWTYPNIPKIRCFIIPPGSS
jgi:hypothetical protein